MRRGNSDVQAWVRDIAQLTEPAGVTWIDGSSDQAGLLTREAVDAGELIPLNPDRYSGCYLHRSSPHQVALAPHQTFLSTEQAEDAGPNNNWLAPVDAARRLGQLFRGCMRGRRLYVLPFLMGPAGSRFARAGVQITDSRYVALSMRLVTNVGAAALTHIAAGGTFTKCVHATGDVEPECGVVVHSPDLNSVWAIGTEGGVKAMFAREGMGLRLGSWFGRREGWLAEHMTVIGIEDPAGRTRYVAGAFPSESGKTNLAMLTPPTQMAGWRVWTVGDDIAWLRPGPGGRLWAVNPEAGFFGLLRGTNRRTNDVALRMIQRNAIFTNAALREDATPWWEGHDDPPPHVALDWQGRAWTPAAEWTAAHASARFAVSDAECSSLSPEANSPNGVPLDAIIFGVRRRDRVPLVCEARDWAHGTFLGATMCSELSASGEGRHARRDPMGMLEFCGYNMADYFQHWLRIGEVLPHPPKIFRVNWYRTGPDGRLLWPGFQDNFRVLHWILQRCEGGGRAVETPVGVLPAAEALPSAGLDLSPDAMRELLKVDTDEWRDALGSQRRFFAQFGGRVGSGLIREHERFAHRLDAAAATDPRRATN